MQAPAVSPGGPRAYTTGSAGQSHRFAQNLGKSMEPAHDAAASLCGTTQEYKRKGEGAMTGRKRELPVSSLSSGTMKWERDEKPREKMAMTDKEREGEGSEGREGQEQGGEERSEEDRRGVERIGEEWS